MEPVAKYLLCDLCTDGVLLRELRDILGAQPVPVREWSRSAGGPAASWPPATLAETAAAHEPQLIFLMMDQAASAEALEFLGTLRRLGNATPVVLVLGEERGANLGALLEVGATDFLLAPLRESDVLARLERWKPRPAAEEAVARHLKERLGLRQFVGESPALLGELRKLARFSRSDAVVLIQGETGTGKEVCARAIHYLSARSGRPFVAVNSGAIPQELVENELFGHETGAFTGARGSQRGVIGDSEGGTLFLDEIDALPLNAQVKLLRFLQEREYRPLGSRRTVRADVRVIAATNQRIREAVAAGRFRADLFYRLNVLPLVLPPLRDRREDIGPLACHFLAKHGAACNQPGRQFAPETLRVLERYDWPGNIRELENVIERALVLSDEPILRPSDVDLPLPATAPAGALEASFRDLKARAVADFERRYLTEMLERHQGNISHAAAAARKNRRAFFQLLRKHRLSVLPTTAADGSRSVRIVIRPDKMVRGGLEA